MRGPSGVGPPSSAALRAHHAASREPGGPAEFRSHLARRGVSDPKAPAASVIAEGERFLTDVVRARAAIDRAVNQALAGRRLSTAEMLALQARVYRFSQDIELAAKVVEKGVGTVRRVMDMQI